MLPVHPLPASHPTRPLIAYALCLFAIASHTVYGAVRARLAEFVPDPGEFTLSEVNDLLPGRWALFDIPEISRTITSHANLADADPSFPWSLLKLPSLETPLGVTQLPWPLREQARFLLGDYQPVPWAAELTPIPGHYAHLSTDKDGLIAYTQDDVKGVGDKQTQIRPGRYLTRYYPELSAADVRRLVRDVPRPATLAFARTADEIEHVYLVGPHSCMSNAADTYEGPCHPVRVYGDSDIALAYAVPPGGKPTARALVWPERQRFGRIYGDEPLLEQLLGDVGFTRGSFAGARIRRIPVEPDDDVRVVMPYLDDAGSFDVVDANWLSIDGCYYAKFTSGVATLEERSPCDNCDDRCAELHAVGTEHWCESCRDSDAFCSDYSGDYFRNIDAVEVVIRRRDDRNITETWAEHELEDEAIYCDGSGAHYQVSRFKFVELKNGETWVAWYFDEHGNPDDIADPDGAITGDNDNHAAGERAAA